MLTTIQSQRFSVRQVNEVANYLEKQGERGTATLMKNLVKAAAKNKQSSIEIDNPAILAYMESSKIKFVITIDNISKLRNNRR